MAKLFLSYSRKDSQRAQHFAEWLQREGYVVWRDDDDLAGGVSFSAEIEKALDDCDAVLVLWSAAAVQSAWVRDEASWGRDSGKLIPLSLDGTKSPLGFRQLQTIDLSKWKGLGAPPDYDKIRRAIARVAGRALPLAETAPKAARLQRSQVLRFPRRPWVAATAAVAVIALVIAIYLWRDVDSGQGITIAVMASPTAPDQPTAADYANVAAADLGSYLPMHFDRATVIAPAEAARDTGGYRIQIAAGKHGRGADASITLSGRGGRGILWSNSWSAPDASAVDLRQKVSLATSEAALCLTEARGETKTLGQPALGLFLRGCTGIDDPGRSEADLLATFERVVKLAPDYPQGWAYLSMGRALFAESQQSRTGMPDEAAIRSTRDAIAMARKLDPRNGLTYLAEWHLASNDPLKGLALLGEGIRLDPDRPFLHSRLSTSLMAVGRMVDGVQEAHRAVELGPLTSFPQSVYIAALTYAGQFSRAKAEIADALKKWPNDPEIDMAEFAFQYRYGDPRVAEKLLPRVTEYSDAGMIPFRKIIAARLDPSPAKIGEAIAAVVADHQPDPRQRNQYLLALGLFGKIDDTYRLLADPKFQRLVDPSILFRPEFAPARADRRFMQVAERLGLVRYWEKSGEWPDFCSSERLSYDCKTEAARYR
jgi:tetratricopeptide (TPR) repeat protein